MTIPRLLRIAVVASLSVSAWAAAPEPLSHSTLEEGEVKLGIGGSYLRTRKNFNRSGDSSSLASNDYLELIAGTGFLQYGATPWLTLIGGGGFVANSVKGVSTATGFSVRNTETGAGDLDLGARVLANRAPIRIIFDALARFPLYSRLPPQEWAALTASTGVPHGDGATELTALGTLEAPVSRDLYVGFRVGVTTRSLGFSSYLPYGAYLKYEEPRGFFVRLGLAGQASVAEDQFTGNTGANDRAATAIAGSQALNAINPSFVKLDGLLGTYIVPAVFVTGGAQLPIWGKNTVAEPQFVASLGLDLGGKAHEADPGYGHSNRGFQEYRLPSKVVQANNELKQILINKGANEGIRVGELLDVFEPDHPDGSFGTAVGRGRVLEVGPTRSKLQILEYFKEQPIEEGFVVRRPVR